MELHVFNIGDIPVRVSIWYALLVLYWFNGQDYHGALIWGAVVTLSILVHELGHALVARHYRLRPGILLHGLGGLCHHDRAERDLHDVFIIAAGPGAGLLLGLLTLLMAVIAPEFPSLASSSWFYPMVSMSLYVNIGWSLINLLPIWPLDGGQLFRLAMLRWFRPVQAEKITHYTAIVLLCLGLIVGSQMRGGFIVMLAIWIGWSNIVALRGDSSSGPIRTTNRQAIQILDEVRLAYANQDFRTAARLGHVLRSERNVPERIAREGLVLLGLASARNGDHEDALRFLRKEKATPDIVEARIECFHALGRESELSQLLDSADFLLVPDTRRREILEIVRPNTQPQT